ncbi:MAG: RluA family pseudouridine synthase [Clostridium sp.]|nr:RluA family pseudouridine synthase [Clostridium sp.]
MNLKYIVDEESSGKTVKTILKTKMQLSGSLIKKLKYQQKILCNGQPVYVNSVVDRYDILEVCPRPDGVCSSIIPQNIPLDILYEDQSFIVINKKPGIVVHPTSNHPDRTLANALSFHLKSNDMEARIHPVMRLDKDTSGIIIFAKEPYSQNFLVEQMKEGTFLKEYAGIVHGIITPETGIIDLPISRMEGSIILRKISTDGKPSITHYEVQKYLKGASLLKFGLKTGRTHQIRVHCQAVGHPLVGDSLYPLLSSEVSSATKTISENSCGNISDIICSNFPPIPPKIINRQALHSYKVAFVHPYTKQAFELTAPLPADMADIVEILGK